MKRNIAIIIVVLSLSACGESVVEREARLKQLPGYQEANAICGQCHAVPSPDQHHPAAWPSVIARMEQLIRTDNRTMPDQKTHDLIVSFFQTAGQR